MRQSGLADLLPALDATVWVGLSAGSMVMTPDGRGGELGCRHQGPAYAIDDETVIKETNGDTDVVSEGRWRLFPS
jgi:dipeptidase E